MPWRVVVWVSGFADPRHAEQWTGKQCFDEDGVKWFEYATFCADDWPSVFEKTKGVETCGLYKRMRICTEECEHNAAGELVPVDCI